MQTITIPIVEDVQLEDTEIVLIKLDSVVNAVLGEDTAVLAILDNEEYQTIYLPFIRKP